MNEIERIKALSNAFGPSGFEEEVVDIARSELSDIYDVKRDHMMNVSVEGKRDEKKPTIMFDAHLDEVGAIVQAVKPNGTMRFLPIGGWQKISFPSSSFLIRSKDGKKTPGCSCCQTTTFCK